jgi:DNA-binding transcriptional LysR family regulator
LQTKTDLNDLRLVHAIQHCGSLAGAARRLGVNHATVFRRLNQLQLQLGVRPTTRPPEHLVGKQLASLSFCAYGSHGYLQGSNNLADADHAWMALDDHFTGHRSLAWLALVTVCESNRAAALVEYAQAAINSGVFGAPHARHCTPNASAFSCGRASDYEVDQRILALDRPGSASLRARCGFLRGLRAIPRGDTWPHAVEIPIRIRPFARASREDDYRVAWAFFEENK